MERMPMGEPQVPRKRISKDNLEEFAKRKKVNHFEKDPGPYGGNRENADVNFLQVRERIENTSSLNDLKALVEDLSIQDGGRGYPWSETPDELIEAMGSYLASGQKDLDALNRVSDVAQLRTRLASLFPPMVH